MKPLRIVPPDDNVVEMPDSSRAMRLSAAALRPSGLSPCGSQAKPAAAIARGLPVVRTDKGEDDHVIINPALKAWMERQC